MEGAGNSSGTLKLISADPDNPLELLVDKDEFVIGKMPSNDGFIGFNNLISRMHCVIKRDQDGFSITDLGSRNGSYLNDARLEPQQRFPLKDGDILAFATSPFRVELESDKREGKIVMVYSPLARTGKTTLALGIASSLAAKEKKTFYINASWFQTFQSLLQNPSEIEDPAVYEKLASGEDPYEAVKDQIKCEGFYYLPPFKAPIAVLGLDYRVYTDMAEKARASGEYDYVIIDADSEFDREKLALMEASDLVVMSVKQDQRSVFTTNLFSSYLSDAVMDKCLFICNDFRSDEEDALSSEDIALKFSIAGRVVHLVDCGDMKAEDLGWIKSMNDVAALIDR